MCLYIGQTVRKQCFEKTSVWVTNNCTLFSLIIKIALRMSGWHEVILTVLHLPVLCQVMLTHSKPVLSPRMTSDYLFWNGCSIFGTDQMVPPPAPRTVFAQIRKLLIAIQ